MTRALALTGRGLINFQLGATDQVDTDLATALALFRDHADIAAQALTYSFYAEVAATRGDIAEGRRRRLEVLDFYCALPDDPFVAAARAYSQGKLGLLDDDLATAERCYRAAADGFAERDRPMMRSMCLGMVADFDERAGDHRAAIAALEEAVEINDALGLRGFMGALLARLGWALLHDGDVVRAEATYHRALDLARRLGNGPVVFLALTGLAVVNRLDGRNRAAAADAVEALELHIAGGPRRLSNRVDPQADVRHRCRGVLRGARVHRRRRRARRGCGSVARTGHDAPRRRPTSPHRRFLADDVDRARATVAVHLGADEFAAAFDRGRARPARPRGGVPQLSDGLPLTWRCVPGSAGVQPRVSAWRDGAWAGSHRHRMERHP